MNIQYPSHVEVVCSASDRDAWLKARGTYWTASAIPVLLRLDGSRKAAIYAKASMADQVENHEIGALPQVQAGRFLEPGVGAWYASECIDDCFPAGELIRRPAIEAPIAVTPDWLRMPVGQPIHPLEIKVVSYESAHNWHRHTADVEKWDKLMLGDFPEPCEVATKVAPNNPTVAAKDAETLRGMFRRHIVEMRRDILPLMGPLMAPVKYYVQLQAQMMVLRASHGTVVCCMGGVNRFDITYEANYALWERLIFESNVAWDEVEQLREDI